MRHTGPRANKLLLALLSVPMGLAIGVPAHANPGIDEPSYGDDGEFLSSLHQLGINFGDPAQAISAAHHVCGLAERGETGLEVLNDLRDQNPGLGTGGAARFATVAAKSYCPSQLEENDHGIK
jgi:hypothetical protein